jgi:UDP-2-acetamido-3-amino-2,3-dideoxy-glucuronate N-acetyltransferase
MNENPETDPFIHPLADVQSTQIGAGTQIWQFAVVLPGARIGEHCNINCHTFLENDVVLGDGVTVKSGVYLWDGIHVESGVFIGPNVTFTNDPFPRSKQRPAAFQRTHIGRNASIGAAATILGGTRIGAYALIAAGSLVSKDVPAHALMRGAPARLVGWVDEQGEKMAFQDGIWYAKDGRRFRADADRLIAL